MTAQTAATIAQDLVEEFDEEQPATEGESPDLNTYRVAVATKAPAEEPITME
ncbi:hypothetical protein [Pseudomonas aeruginosa]|uniref:hypothetical protein n=1 Tax=Pseudomonas aeruginosa TaxID=287 RepID=UPI000A3FB536|nr:hypothetical protein [Pseudomonas aeruginosa]HBP4928918.1 hypothetical protein [Pseudomonas aeruginosa]